MTYYPDLSPYEYYRGVFDRPRTLNVGWLAREHAFDAAPPSDELLDVTNAEYKDERLLLGTSELRVFDDNGDVYAAPTLIFHYVQRHHYRPPPAFVAARQK